MGQHVNANDFSVKDALVGEIASFVNSHSDLIDGIKGVISALESRLSAVEEVKAAAQPVLSGVESTIQPILSGVEAIKSAALESPAVVQTAPSSNQQTT